MTVLVCNNTPPYIRGHLKQWFIEPKPNVFVGTLNSKTHSKVMEYILRNSPKDFGVLSITSFPNCQGYNIESSGETSNNTRKTIEVSGVMLIKVGNVKVPF